MDAKGLFLTIGLFLIIWFAFGFVAFLIEVKRTQSYERFDGKTKEDFILITGIGLFSFIVVIFLVIKEWFEDWMDDLLWKINHP